MTNRKLYELPWDDLDRTMEGVAVTRRSMRKSGRVKVSKVTPKAEKKAVNKAEKKTESAEEVDSGAAKNGPPERNQLHPILDRSRAELRLPAELLSEALRLTHAQRHKDKFDRPPEGAKEPDDTAVKLLEQGNVMRSGRLDPIAFEMLDVVNTASLMIAIDLRFGGQSSLSTLWATPKLVVTSRSFDPGYFEFHAVEVAQLSQLLAQLVVLRSPIFVGQAPIAVNAKAIVAAENQSDAPAEALETLVSSGLTKEEAEHVLAFQGDRVRQWRISSSWSTDEGAQTAELRGVDAGPNGQWLLALTGSLNTNGLLNFTPQGPGQVMKSLRSILPKYWTGTPLNQPPA